MTRQRLLAALALPALLLAAFSLLRPERSVKPRHGNGDDFPVPAAAARPADGTADAAPITLAEAPAPPADAAEAAPPPAESVDEASEDFAALPDSEQRSLWNAFHAARRAVLPLTAHEAALPHNEGVQYFAQNPGQQITARFLDGAMRLGSGQGGEWTATLALAGGRATPPVLVDGRVEYRHAHGVTEWYENRPEGIEHAFTVARRTAGPGEALRLDLELSGVAARRGGEPAEGGSGTLEFLAEDGAPVLRYGEVKAWDAAGRVLAARYEVSEDRVGILVADAGAVYPVTIDPLVTSLEAKLGAGDAAAGDLFGYSVSLDGDTALVGAFSDDTAAGADAGSAHVFVRSGNAWEHQALLLAPDAATGDRFGSSVSLNGDTALVGAYGDDTAAAADAGSAHVFVRSGTAWAHQALLLAPDAAAYDSFGRSVSLDGDTALVGAPYDDTAAAADAGSAHVFVRSGNAWTHQALLLAPDAAAGDYFGSSVSLDGDTALVGAYYDDTASGANAGSAHVFVRSGNAWAHQALLLAPDAAAGDNFGSSVSLDGDTALVGAYRDDTAAGTDAGSAHVFVRSGNAWDHQARLGAGDAAAYDTFGRSVSLDGDTALVGAPYDDTAAGADAGSAHVFVRSGTTWTHQATLLAPDADDYDYFGISVCLDGDTALVGAYGDSIAAGNAAGSAHVFVRNDNAWTHQALLLAPDADAYDSFGASVSLDGDTALVGAVFDNTAAGTDAGSAHVFVRNGNAWTHQATLLAPDADAYDSFGYSVSLDGDTALVGAVSDDTAAGADAGSAHVFVRSGNAWTHQALLLAPDAAAGDSFGRSVSLDGDTALVGAPYDDTAAGAYAGSAHVFVRSGTTWTRQALLLAPDADAYDTFGISVSLDGDTALVGADGDDTAAGTNVGSAYVFRIFLPRLEVYDGLSTSPANRRDDGTAPADFGSVHAGGSSPASTFTLLNAGDADLVLGAVSLSGPGAGLFSATQPSATLLAPGATATFSVSFAPVAGGPAEATVEIASDDPRLPSFRLPVLGEGLGAPAFSTPSLRLPAGGGPIDLAAATGATPPGGIFGGPGVAGGLFDPRSLPPGSYGLTYTVTDSHGNVRTAPLSVAVLSGPLLKAKVPKAFAPTVLGARGGTRRLLVANRGEQSATGLKASLKGPGRADFRLRRPSVRTLEPGATATVVASFRPRKPGLRRATVQVAAREAKTSVVLRGRGVLPEPAGKPPGSSAPRDPGRLTTGR